MGDIQSAIKLFDGYSPIIKNMIKVNQNIISSFGSIEQASSNAFNVQAIQAAQNALARVETDFDGVERQIREADEQQKKFTQDIRNSDVASKSLLSTFGKIAGTVGTFIGVKKVFDLSDQVTLTTARLNLMNDGLQTTAQLQDKIFASAQRSRSAYLETADAVSKLGVLAGNAFASNDEIIAFSELVNKTFKVGGQDIQTQTAAMRQLTQAMAAGVLRGDELVSVMEGAPMIAQAITKYMQNAGVEGSIQDWAAGGLLTAEVVKNALFALSAEINAEFDKFPKTIGDVWTSIKSTALKEFTPVLNKINEVVNSEKFNRGIQVMTNALVSLAGVALRVFEVIGNVAIWIGDNWSWLTPIVMGVVGAFVAYNAVAWISAAATTAIAIAKGIYIFALSIFNMSAAKATAAQWKLNAAMYANPIGIVIAAIVALIAIIYGVVAAINKFTGSSTSATGIIIGAFAVLAAFVWNIIVGVIDAIIQFLWTYFVEPWIGIIEFVLNVFNGGFNSFGDAVKNLLGNIISWFLSLGQVVTKIIDAIFGTNWTSGLESMKNTVLSWGKNENAITLSRQAPSLSDLGVGRWAYSDAWSAGYGLGKGIEDKVGGMFNFDGAANTPANDLGNYLGEIQGGVDDVAGSTASMANSLDYAEEDLKYMRDIAERDAVNRYTTAEIHIEQNNENHISSNMDLDGVIGYLNEGVEEAVDIATEGDHG